MGVEHFVAAYAVCSEAFPAYIFKKPSLYIGLYCIMYFKIMPVSKFCHMVHRLSEQVHVIVVERRSYLVKLFYCIDIQHIVSDVIFYSLPGISNRAKTVAKITKKIRIFAG